MTTEVQAISATKSYDQSQALFEKAQNYLPGGNSRYTVYYKPHPVYFREGRGSRVYDVDGNEYLDFINNYTSLIHGHAQPEIEAAVIEAVRRGTAFAGPTESEVSLAKLLCERLPAVEQVRFTNSGSEAVMNAMKAARAYTGKPAIAKFEGCYHGSYDYAEVSQAPSARNWGDLASPASVAYPKGTPQGVLDDVVVLPFNYPDETVAILRRHQDRLAGVILDSMPARLGMPTPTPEFLQALQAECKALGILFILDDVINLRLAYQGSTGLYQLDPDLTTMAKIIGGGFPIGAVGGKREVMAVFDPTIGPKPALPHGGTYNANPISMLAGLKAMELMTPAAFERLNGLGENLRQGLRQIIQRLGLDWQVSGAGSLFQLLPMTTEVVDYRSSLPTAEQYAKITQLHHGMLERGIFLSTNSFGCVSTAMTETDLATMLEKAEEVLKEVSNS